MRVVPKRLALTPTAAARPAVSYRLSVLCAALACALAPAYVIRWHVGFYPTTLLEASILLTLLVFFVETIRQRSRIEWRSPFTIPAILFITAGALSVLVAPDKRAALGLYRAYLLEPIAFFVVLATILRTVERAVLVLLGLFAGGLAVAVPNLVVSVGPLVFGGLARPVVIYTTPNAVPLYLIPLIGPAAGLLLYASGTRLRAVGGLFLAFSVPASLLSFSRGGVLALGAVAVGLALTHRRRIWLLPAVLAGIGLLLVIPGVTHRFFALANLASVEEARTSLWKNTIALLAHHPILGVGLSGFAHAMEAFVPGYRTLYNAEPIYPHNIVLNFWSVTGLLGLVSFAWLVLQGFRTSWQGWRSSAATWGAIQLGVVLVLVGILVHGLVDVPYFKNDLSLEFWALLGLSWAGVRWSGLLQDPG